MSKLKVIVAGAAGRMGQLIAELVKNADDMELCGALDMPERLKSLEYLECHTDADADRLLAGIANATIIDFTAAAPALRTAMCAAKYRARIVIGATGFSEPQKQQLAAMAEKTPVLWSANMSVGINALLGFLPRLAQKLGADYDMEIVEAHHRHKKDAPSGTALMLADALAQARGWDTESVRKCCRDGIIGERPAEEIGIMALRGGDVVGEHSVYFFGAGETIEIRHDARSRMNFAQGALRAARWLSGQQPGRLYSMMDVLA